MIRTRFAPSPTGYLHIGGARTALYCWLFARKNKGTFILRIEDTDRERSTDESIQAIFEAMQWLGLQHDEGPYFQTQRFDRYREVAEKLLTEGHAYRCYCSKERLEALRVEQMANKQKPRYDGHCRDLVTPPSLDQSFCLRFRNPQTGEVVVDDQVYGRVVFQNSELDDLVIVRSDGTPTYNFTVVVDDWDMRITHVIRGDDHLNNTPRQINILKVLGAELPIYAHVPMILGSDGKRLSKRHGAVGVMNYRNEGFLPQALLNYLVRLGWSHGDQEIFSLEEMVDFFDMGAVNKSPAAFNPEKLLWLNQHYIKNSDPAFVATQLEWHMQQLGIDYTNGPTLSEIVTAQSERAKTLQEMAEKSRYFYQENVTYNESAVQKHVDASLIPALKEMRQGFADLANWDKEAIHGIILAVAEKLQLKLGKVAQPLRIAVTGDTISPPIDLTLQLLGQARTVRRLDTAIKSWSTSLMTHCH
ncbi:glutamate--tRNA ligase [soil metagenome]